MTDEKIFDVNELSLTDDLPAKSQAAIGRDFRFYLLARRDLQMPAGKLAAQAGHAFVDCAFRFCRAPENRELFDAYQRSGQTKIVLGVDDLNQLMRLRDDAIRACITTATVMDEGRTVFNGVPTITVCALGLCRRIDLPSSFLGLTLYQ